MASPLPVLVVEDDHEIREVMVELLEAAGHPTRQAADGDAALAALATLRGPWLMVLDLVMPELGGPDVLRALESFPLANQVRVLLVSGDQHRLAEAGAHPRVSGTLCKPFRVGALLAWIAQLDAPGAAQASPP